MKFDDLDSNMRVYETAHDHAVLPYIYMVARLDGRSFTRLTKESQQFEAPFDVRFRDIMAETVIHLMNCGFRVVYGYTQSDEISLLLHLHEASFGRKLRKLNSVLAGEASAKFSLLLGDLGCFDCRISQLPAQHLVVDYFRWRQADAERNALSSHCYWLLRKEGQSVRQATAAMEGMSVPAKHELLFSRNINFNDLPNWQKRGSGFYWEQFDKEGFNPKTGETVIVQRTRIKRDIELPIKEEYTNWIADLVEKAAQDTF